MDAVRTLCTRYYWQIWFFTRRPQSALTGFQNAVQTLWHRRLVWQGLKWASLASCLNATSSFKFSLIATVNTSVCLPICIHVKLLNSYDKKGCYDILMVIYTLEHINVNIQCNLYGYFPAWKAKNAFSCFNLNLKTIFLSAHWYNFYVDMTSRKYIKRRLFQSIVCFFFRSLSVIGAPYRVIRVSIKSRGLLPLIKQINGY